MAFGLPYLPLSTSVFVDPYDLGPTVPKIRVIAPEQVSARTQFEALILAEQVQDIEVFDLILKYDQNLFEVTDITAGTAFFDCLILSSSHPGALRLKLECDSGRTGSLLEIWKVKFRASPVEGPVTTQLEPIEVTLIDGNGVEFEANTVPAELTILPAICGDQNADGRVSVVDAAISLQIIDGLIAEPTELQKVNGDLDRDGQITEADVLILMRHIAGLELISDCGPQ